MNLSIRRLCFIFLLISSLAASPVTSTAQNPAPRQAKPRSDSGPDDVPNTQNLTLPFTAAGQARDLIRLPEGFSATLFAAEPDIIQPIAATTDSRGRLWVVENLTYSDGRENYNTRLNDRVVILEDTDHDGQFDVRTVFWDQGKKLTGIELGFGGVWLTSAPNLLFVPDNDHDDRPDAAPQILLNGFNGDVIRHNIVNGLRWGPDGWLYGRHGIQATSFVGKPGATESQRIPMNCAIWRYHPTKHLFEIVAEGGTNPWGFDFDDYGEMFMINTVIGHLFHVVPGARYRRMYGAHFNPHTYQVIEQTADHFHWDTSEEHWHAGKDGELSSGTDAAGGGHAHTGLMIYLGDNWPARYRNQLFTANFHGRRINCDRIERLGNGYVGRHEADFMKTDDPWFRGVEMLYGPDGAVYLLDWSDIGECHENDGIHRTSGRIFKISFGTPVLPDRHDVSRWTDDELVACHHWENQWYYRHARRILQERHAAGEDMTEVVKKLRSFCRRNLDEDDCRPLLRAVWSLYAIDGLSNYFGVLLHHGNEHVQAWTIRLLADMIATECAWLDAHHGGVNGLAKGFADKSTDPTSPLVRLYFASSLGRFPMESRLDIAAGLIAIESDADDRTQPQLIWYGIEPAVVGHWQKSLELAKASRIPLIRENIVRRLTAEVENSPEMLDAIVGWLGSETEMDLRADVLRGMNSALDGWVKAPMPDGWSGVAEELAKSSELQPSVSRLNLVFGDGRAIEQLRTMANSAEADTASRRQAIVEYAKTSPDDLFDFLAKLINDKSFSNAVMQAMVHCGEPDVAGRIVGRFPHLDPEGKLIAIDTLTARESWSQTLLDAVEGGRIPKSAISALHARQMQGFGNPQLTDQLTRAWGSIRNTDTEKQLLINQLRGHLTRDNLDARDTENGKTLFDKNCRNCHVLYGSGETIGPDLTGGDRKNLEYLLENIVDPSASVADSYRTTLVLLDDGRLVSGVVLQKTDRIIRIQTAEEVVALDRNQIEEMKRTEKSLMPDGLLDKLSTEEIRDLFGYLIRN